MMDTFGPQECSIMVSCNGVDFESSSVLEAPSSSVFVYKTPIITDLLPSKGVYTNYIDIIGKNFIETGFVKGVC